MRYEDVFLLEALMLKMKSNVAFKHFRNNKILPLPSPSTIGNLTSSSNCHFGFNEFALENIENALKENKIWLPNVGCGTSSEKR